MNNISIKEIKKTAWINARRNWTDLILTTLLAIVLVTFTCNILAGPVIVGLYFVIYTSLGGSIITPSIFFDGFKRNVLTAIVAEIIICLISFIPGWIIELVLGGIAKKLFSVASKEVVNEMLYGSFHQFDLLNGASVGLVLVMLLITLISAVVAFFIFYAFSMTLYIIMLEDGIGIIDSLKKSVLIMKGNKRRFFLFDFSFIGWFALCIVTFGILLFWVVPYYFSARVMLMDNIYKNSPYKDYTEERDFAPLMDVGTIGVSHKKAHYDYESPVAPQEKYCRYCGSEKAEGVKFCHICGKEQIEPSDEIIATTVLYCKWCGQQLAPGAKYCDKCGRKQTLEEDNLASKQEIANYSEGRQEPPAFEKESFIGEVAIRDNNEPQKSGNKKMLPIIAILVIVAAAIAIGLFFFIGHSSKSTEINLSDIKTAPTLDGYNGEGYVMVEPEVDEAAANILLSDIDNVEQKSGVSAFLSTVAYSTQPNDYLSNGDQITIYASYDEKLAEELELDIKGVTSEYTVKDLPEEEYYDDALEDQDYSEGILPNSSSEYITEYDAQALSYDELQYAINEIYARHGRIFTDPDVKAYFNSLSWYSGTKKDVSMNELNEYEQENIKTLTNERERRDSLAEDDDF